MMERVIQLGDSPETLFVNGQMFTFTAPTSAPISSYYYQDGNGQQYWDPNMTTTNTARAFNPAPRNIWATNGDHYVLTERSAERYRWLLQENNEGRLIKIVKPEWADEWDIEEIL